ncbi:MAG: CHAT domain-containing protein [Burkholderiales bacterium]|nr:CHAT domain-containing protein [Burkholderiales bacterium]
MRATPVTPATPALRAALTLRAVPAIVAVPRATKGRAAKAIVIASVAAVLLAAAAGSAAAAACSAEGGPLRLAVTGMQAELERTTEPLARARGAAALGAAWLRLDRQDEAARTLQQALAGPLPPRERAAVLLDLGNLALTQRRHTDADTAWKAAAALAPDDAELALAAELNRLRLPDWPDSPDSPDAPAAPDARAGQARPGAPGAPGTPGAPGMPNRAARLQAALVRSAALGDASVRARHTLNIAAQAAALGPASGELAWRAYEQGRMQALAAGEARLAAEAYEGLAALYEAQQRPDEALRLVEEGIVQARRAGARERLMQLEGLAGRLAARLGDGERALAAYRRAVEHVEAVRSDIPVRYQDGRSSFRDTLEPLYLGLTDQLLRRADAVPAAERGALLRQARDTVELIKQTELEDWLASRCGVEANRGSWKPPPGSALLHPIILPDRLELLVETANGMQRRTSAIAGPQLRDEVLEFVAALRERQPLRSRAEGLHAVLVAPLEPLFAAEGIHTLVVVPDGVLRLLPFAALHDGRDWLLQRYAFATVPGLSLTPAPRHGPARLQALLTGMAEPGPVLEKLPRSLVDSVLDGADATRQGGGQGAAAPASSTSGAGNAATAGSTGTAPPAVVAARTAALREALALPGVKGEIEALARVLPGTVLLDRGFTLQALKARMRASAPPVVHIASHGVFGSSAESTFIMTYDELLTLDGLQSLLRDERPRESPIELLTLSACQTAEGDDRAPLGMSGTALKARARTVLGTLWPVADDAAQFVMEGFYRHLVEGRLSRAASLRDAQLALLARPGRSHPFFWAPFALIGDWQ